MNEISDEIRQQIIKDIKSFKISLEYIARKYHVPAKVVYALDSELFGKKRPKSENKISETCRAASECGMSYGEYVSAMSRGEVPKPKQEAQKNRFIRHKSTIGGKRYATNFYNY